MNRFAAGAASVPLALALALTGCSPNGASEPDPTPTAAPRLEPGELEVVFRQPLLESTEIGEFPSLEPGFALSEKWIAVVSPPLGSVSLFDRASLTEQWTAEIPAGDWGTCGPPAFVSEKIVAVVAAVDTNPCSRFILYDAKTGDVLTEHSFLTQSILGVDFYDEIAGTARIDGRLWYATHNTVGYLDPETGQFDVVLAGEEIGIHKDDDGTTYNAQLIADPESGTLVTRRLSTGAGPGGSTPNDYFGIRVDGEDAEVVWSFGTTLDQAGDLGVADLDLADPYLVVRDDEPGLVFLTRRVSPPHAMGVLDPKTGRAREVILPTVPTDVMYDLDNDGNLSYELIGDLLVTATSLDAEENDVLRLIGYDVGTGEEVWNVTPLGPDDGWIHDVSRGTDDQLYILSQDILTGSGILRRIDQKTGATEEQWEIPEGLVGEFGVEAHVVDDAVVISWASELMPSSPVPPLIILKTAKKGS